MMDLARARFLVSARGREALAGLDPMLAALPLHTLAHELRRNHSADDAAALAEQVTLRHHAIEKLGADVSLLLTREGLEMMTPPAVAARRAARLAALDLPILDLTCGLGGDLLAVVNALTTGPVGPSPLRPRSREKGSGGEGRAIGLEKDPATAILAAANVPGATIVRGDAAGPPFALAHSAIILDPSRRSAAGRRFDPAAFSPNWNTCLALLDESAAGVLKASPGLDHTNIPANAEAEFVQLDRSMRECTIWTGVGAEPGLRRAVLLPAGVELTSEAPEAATGTIVPGAFVFDPESCVTRAGLVRHLAQILDARMMDPQIAYLTASAPAYHAMSACFEVLEVVPFSIARLRTALRAGHWRPVDIRRRAFPIEPPELLRLLGRMEGDPITLLCTTFATRRTIFIARQVARPTASPVPGRGNSAGR